jgi:hypothetical protein
MYTRILGVLTHAMALFVTMVTAHLAYPQAFTLPVG